MVTVVVHVFAMACTSNDVAVPPVLTVAVTVIDVAGADTVQVCIPMFVQTVDAQSTQREPIPAPLETCTLVPGANAISHVPV